MSQLDEVRGRVKEAAGKLSGDKRLKRDGRVSLAVGRAKGGARGVRGKVADLLHKEK